MQTTHSSSLGGRLFLALFLLIQLCGLNGETAASAGDKLFLEILTLAEQGDREAQFSLALMYDTGDPARQNPEQAVYWFSKAAEAGVAGACLYLGMKYEFGVQVGKDTAKAQHWYTQAALKGWPQAAFMLANLYFNASPADLVSGCAWMALARDQDFPGADQLHQQYCADLSTAEVRKTTDMATDLNLKIYPAEFPSGNR